MDALWLVKHGLGAAGIKEKLERNALNSIVFLGVDDLDYLRQGGRITPSAAAVASVLNIKPLLTIGGSNIDVHEKVRGRKNCEKKLIHAIWEKGESFKTRGFDIRIGITGNFLKEEDRIEWYNRAKETFPNDELIYDPFTCSISSHVGPNSFGMGVSAKITL